MKFSFKHAGIMLGLILVTSHSFAGSLAIEPYAGYGLGGSLKAGTATTSDTYNGVALGARGFVRFANLIFIGPDFSYYPSLSYTDSMTNTAYTNKSKSLKLGVVVGVSVPVMPLRFWLGYNFIDHMDVNTSTPGTTSSLGYSGYSMKAGVGLSIIPMISINAEFIHTQYGNVDYALNGTTTSDPLNGTAAVSGNLFLLSFSVPVSSML